MDLNIVTPEGITGSVTVSDKAFGRKFSEDLVHQAVVAYMAGGRQGSKAQKNRAAVAGGGKKPWRQKGTGRARAGTSSSPIWRSGGVTFAAETRDYKQKLNRKMYRGAMRAILSELVRLERLVCVEEFTLDEAKTKKAIEKLAEINLSEALIITDEVTRDLYMATRNIPRVDIIDTTEIDPYSLIGFDNVLITKGALEKVEAWLS